MFLYNVVSLLLSVIVLLNHVNTYTQYLVFSYVTRMVQISCEVRLAPFVICCLSYDVASGSEITPCNKICKTLVVYRFSGNVMTSITTLRTQCQNYNVFTAEMRFQSLNVI